MRSPIVPALLLALASLAHAADDSIEVIVERSVTRYNDPPAATQRSRLAARVEELAQRIAPSLKRPVPRVDPRLEQACAALLPFVPDGAPPEHALVEEALRIHGIIEPSPHLVVVAVAEGGEATLISELEARLPAVMKQGSYRRMGVAVGTGGSHQSRMLIAFQESFVDLAPVLRRLPAGGRALLDGKVLPPYQRAALLIQTPDGTIARSPFAPIGGRFQSTFQCGSAPGRYQIEITAEDTFGPSVLANFPVYCGVAAPIALVAPTTAVAPERAWSGPADAEAQILELLNRDRARAGLPSLAVDARLARAARAHADDMRDKQFVGHLSPTTGSANDRLKRIGVEPILVLENVGRAYSPREAERGLMDSPGHRANILSSDVEKVGIGVAVALGPRGERELLVTQLFVHLRAPFDAERAPAQLRARLDDLRRGAGVLPLGDDRELDALATEVAKGVADGTLSADRPGAPVERTLPRLGDRYRTLRTVVIPRALEVAQITGSPALLDPKATHAGAAVVARQRDRADEGLCMVVVLGARR
ncbi:MAG: hypothetical protein EXR72_09425 [Myxococcales bacterium]|nr:hypothetical protein [Myxococcales bacterium]